MTSVYRIDPLCDPRWEEFLQGHPDASVFHTRAWLDSLRLTYDYQSEAFTTSAPDRPLQDAIVFCRIDSWLTGSRLVSVAFADHCQPLVSSAANLESLVSSLQDACREELRQYVELRWINSSEPRPTSLLYPSVSYIHHALDLRPELERVFRRFHKSCIQRKIYRAEREGLEYQEGSSDEMLREFYRLFTLTRRRHGLPPQPLAWFRNLRDSFGAGFNLRVASKENRALASILTLQFKKRLVYKYGCSDARFHHLGTMPWLFWRTVRDAKERRLVELDLGRSDLTDHGLIAFKDHLGANSSTLTNYRHPQSEAIGLFRLMAVIPGFWAHLPVPVLKAAGSLLYRHIG